MNKDTSQIEYDLFFQQKETQGEKLKNALTIEICWFLRNKSSFPFHFVFVRHPVSFLAFYIEVLEERFGCVPSVLQLFISLSVFKKRKDKIFFSICTDCK